MKYFIFYHSVDEGTLETFDNKKEAEERYVQIGYPDYKVLIEGEVLREDGD